MKGYGLKAIFAVIFLIVGGCSGPVHYSNSSTSEVGTAWGNDVHSTVEGVSAIRAERDPSEVILIGYSAKQWSGYENVYSIRISDLEYAVRDANFNSIPISRRYNSSTGQWQYHIQARVGMNYQLYVRNYSRDTRYEIVATVDGLDVLNGESGSLNNNGYIVNAGDSLAIKGFRKDKNTEAAFQFADVSDSYAANSAQGDVRNVGVIGFAAFALQGPGVKSLPLCSAQAFPADGNGYAPPPCRK